MLIREGRHRCNKPDECRHTPGAIWECGDCGKQYQYRIGWGWMRKYLERVVSA